jgi:hypothetical protein
VRISATGCNTGSGSKPNLPSRLAGKKKPLSFPEYPTPNPDPLLFTMPEAGSPAQILFPNPDPLSLNLQLKFRNWQFPFLPLSFPLIF